MLVFRYLDIFYALVTDTFSHAYSRWLPEFTSEPSDGMYSDRTDRFASIVALGILVVDIMEIQYSGTLSNAVVGVGALVWGMQA